MNSQPQRGQALVAISRRVAAISLAVLLSVIGQTAWGNGDNIYIDCPCRLSSDGATMTITLGVRSFRGTNSDVLRVSVYAYPKDSVDRHERRKTSEANLTTSLGAGDRLAPMTISAPIEIQSNEVKDLQLVLDEQIGTTWWYQDRIWLAPSVTLSEPFDIADLDYLEDSDGDGVGDINEVAEGTDPNDANSKPNESTIDLLTLYSQSYSELHQGEPTTYMQHQIALANTIFANSGLSLQLRPVGSVEVTIDEDDEWSKVEETTLIKEVARHQSDLTVLYRPSVPNAGSCGWAYLGGYGDRGRLLAEEAETGVSNVMGMCGAAVLAHELGHALGLGHSFWQHETGTWRWSRGHAIDNDFGTVMTYGPKGGGPSLDVFSNPETTCRGQQETDAPCGLDGEEIAGADAVASLNAVRHQVAAFQEAFQDSDGDGFVDPVDELPMDASDWLDSDGDGIGNKRETDDDNDGVNDELDAFPHDPTESADTDGDGVGDNGDAFPNDPSESSDRDGDGVGDNSDEFPDNPSEWLDSDGDGVGNNGDLFPDDPTDWADMDGDGLGDNADPDADGDGVLNTHDLFPLDPEKSDISSYVFIPEGLPDSQSGSTLLAQGHEEKYIVIGRSRFDSRRGAIYLINVSDLELLDAADGRTDREIMLAHFSAGRSSWRLTGENSNHYAGAGIASIGDMNDDGIIDLLIGAVGWERNPSIGSRGAVYFISGDDLAQADAADGVSDSDISLAHVVSQPDSWMVIGDECENFGSALAIQDLNHDRRLELLVVADTWCYSSPESTEQLVNSIYLAPLHEFAEADAEDDLGDDMILVENVVSRPNSYRMKAAHASWSSDAALRTLTDMDGDGLDDIAIGLPNVSVAGNYAAGTAYLIASGTLSATDVADGDTDGILDLARVANGEGSWQVSGVRAWERFGREISQRDSGEVILGNRAGTFFVDTNELATIDAADGELDGMLTSTHLSAAPNLLTWLYAREVSFTDDVDGDGSNQVLYRWLDANVTTVATFNDWVATDDAPSYGVAWDDRTWHLTKPTDRILTSMSAAGDIDDDGLIDILISETYEWNTRRVPKQDKIYLISGADLFPVDVADGMPNRETALDNLAGDADNDGISNTLDSDDDEDGVLDREDAFQLDPNEWLDTDYDGIGDNSDAFPNDWSEQWDTDGDGVGDEADDDDDGDGIVDREDRMPLDTDNDGLDNRVDLDDDNDGVLDAEDDLPFDPTEWLDSDDDGIGNNLDQDDDNDGVLDEEDALPLDATESVDSDDDGVGDNADAFPLDPNEHSDADGDGIGDNADLDDDNDGVPDLEDEYPLDGTAAMDSDGDGVPDSRDAFPTDPKEWLDSDGDGIGDNADKDRDNDGVENDVDRFPDDATRWKLLSLAFHPESDSDMLGHGLAGLGDLDGDGLSEIGLVALEHDESGALYILSSNDHESADLADGNADGAVLVEHIASQPDSWKVVGEDGARIADIATTGADIEGDGTAEIIVAAPSLSGISYVVSTRDLLGMDAHDGQADGVLDLAAVTDSVASWRLRGIWGGGIGLGATVSGSRPYGISHLFFGQPGSGAGDRHGTAHLMNNNQIATLDEMDNDVDRTVHMWNHQGPWLLRGENPRDAAGSSLAIMDFDNDNAFDLVIGASQHDANRRDDGAVYLVSNDSFLNRRSIELEILNSEPSSFKLVGEIANGNLGVRVVPGDLNGDGHDDIVIAANSGVDSNPLINVISGTLANLRQLDIADGSADGLVQLQEASMEGHWRISVSSRPYLNLQGLHTLDANGDGQADLLLPQGRKRWNVDQIEFLLVPADVITANNPTGGTIEMNDIYDASYRFRLHWTEWDGTSYRRHVHASTVGDLDDDGRDEMLFSVFFPTRSVTYLVFAADLEALDNDDGLDDNIVDLDRITSNRY